MVTYMLWSSMESQGIHIYWSLGWTCGIVMAPVGYCFVFWFWKVWSWLGDDFQKDLAVFGWLFTRNGWTFWIKSRTNTGSPWFLLPKSRGKPLNLPISSLNNSRCLRVAEHLILTTGCPRVYHLKPSLLVKHIFSMVSCEYHGKFMG